MMQKPVGSVARKPRRTSLMRHQFLESAFHSRTMQERWCLPRRMMLSNYLKNFSTFDSFMKFLHIPSLEGQHR
ncbi:hypothetical protein GW17_00029449 [Ensete ventricosum]|nr:hypothetical protein GW17_00029449 [Ensete ventricosum]